MSFFQLNLGFATNQKLFKVRKAGCLVTQLFRIFEILIDVAIQNITLKFCALGATKI